MLTGNAIDYICECSDEKVHYLATQMNSWGSVPVFTGRKKKEFECEFCSWSEISTVLHTRILAYQKFLIVTIGITVIKITHFLFLAVKPYDIIEYLVSFSRSLQPELFLQIHCGIYLVNANDAFHVSVRPRTDNVIVCRDLLERWSPFFSWPLLVCP